MNKLTKLDVQLYDLFDDWSEIDPRQKHGTTKEECIAELKRVAKLLGHTPINEEFRKHSSMSRTTVVRLFDTWNKALDAAGLTRIVSYDHTKSQIIAELKRVAKSLGHTPTQKEFNEHGSMSTRPMQTLFGTWKKALDAADLKRNKTDGITKAQALAELKRVAKQLGHTPTTAEFSKHGSRGTTTVVRVFGSWNKALDVAGLKRNHNMDGITKAQVLAELKRVARKLGHTPSVREFDSHSSTMCAGTVINKFGTWNKALKAAGLKVNMIFTRRK